jgi:hypothetical protein
MEEKHNDEARTWEPMEVEESGHIGEVMQVTSKFSGAQYDGSPGLIDTTT